MPLKTNQPTNQPTQNIALYLHLKELKIPPLKGKLKKQTIMVWFLFLMVYQSLWVV